MGVFVDPVSLAVGGGLVLVGWLAGRISRKTAADPNKPICACDHPVSMHREEGGCAAEIKRPHSHKGFEWVKCPCLRYVGPLPLDQYWAPPIASGDGA